MPRHQLTNPDPIEFPDLALHNLVASVRPNVRSLSSAQSLIFALPFFALILKLFL